MLERRLSFLGVNSHRKLEGSLECTMVEFSPVIGTGLFFGFLINLCMQGQGFIMEGDGKVILVDTRKFSPDTEFLFAIDEVYARTSQNEPAGQMGER